MTLSAMRRFFCQIGVAGALALTAGCQSASLDDLASGTSTSAPRNTQTFPNLNVAPTPETTQFTSAEKDAKIAELRAAQSAQQGQGGGAAQTAETTLRKAGQSQQQTLSDIENE